MKTSETFVFTQDDVLAFARLSGDFNPIHIDPLQARREVFGQTVVHGIFALLRMLEHGLPPGDSVGLSAISAHFSGPVFTNTPLTLERTRNGFELYSKTNRLITLSAAINPCPAACPEPPPPPAIIPDKPLSISIDDTPASEYLPIWLDTTAFRRLFPGLRLPSRQVAEIVSLSRLVGMVYPGARSLFSQLDLHTINGHDRCTLSFGITRKDPRFSMVDMQVSGREFCGSIRAFFRPPPFQQPSYADLQDRSGAIAPLTARVVIIGASRGIGEVSAKLAAAAGAEVLLTYRQGKDDTEAIVNEINNGGGHASMAAYDVSSSTPIVGWEDATHVLYFATPPVFQSRCSPFDAPLFECFKTCYVDNLLRTVSFFPEATLFFPSSIAIEEKPGILPEYSSAKFLGEQVCAALQREGRRVITERLPRIATDQTRTVGMPFPAADAADIMLPILAKCFHKHTRGRQARLAPTLPEQSQEQH